jgi:hypothetical protein
MCHHLDCCERLGCSLEVVWELLLGVRRMKEVPVTVAEVDLLEISFVHSTELFALVWQPLTSLRHVLLHLTFSETVLSHHFEPIPEPKLVLASASPSSFFRTTWPVRMDQLHFITSSTSV